MLAYNRSLPTPTHIFIAPGLSIRVVEFKVTIRILRTLKSSNQKR